MRNLLVLVFMLGLTASTQAVNLAFKFEVTSSGTSMYACNAGLKHQLPSHRVCYERTNPTKSCAPTQCVEGEACHCVCTGGDLGGTGSRAGENRLDFFSASYANWSDNGELPTGHSTKRYTADTSGHTFRSLFTDTTKFSKQLKTLSFELGSERYGAEYYVDICFRAPQIDYPSSGYDNNDKLRWDLKSGVTITDLGTTQSPDTYAWDLNTNHDVWYKSKTYENLSDLKVKGYLYCKNKDNSSFSKNSSFTNFSGGQIKQLISTTSYEDLKGCYFRYFFKETKTSGVASVRKWKKQKARICTYASANEPAE